jgi:hypothetical protein
VDVTIAGGMADMQFPFAVRAFQHAAPVLTLLFLSDRVDDFQRERHLCPVIGHLFFTGGYFLVSREAAMLARRLLDSPFREFLAFLIVGLEAWQCGSVGDSSPFIHFVIDAPGAAGCALESVEVDAFAFHLLSQ